MYKGQTVAVVLPALNEQESIAEVISSLRVLRNPDHSAIVDDIVVCDNASTDSTAAVANAAGARVVYQSERGYGAACLTAIAELRNPDVVVFVDADRSVLTKELVYLLDAIASGYELVIGSRTLGHCEKGSLTPQQRIGNLIASAVIRCLWRQPVTDLGPFRAIRYTSLQQIGMSDRAFGWTVEMQVKAILFGLRVAEVPVSSVKRIGRSKISGTVRGTLGAAHGIFSTIFRLWWKQKEVYIENALISTTHIVSRVKK